VEGQCVNLSTCGAPWSESAEVNDVAWIDCTIVRSIVTKSGTGKF
jgi:hypothetical protein